MYWDADKKYGRMHWHGCQCDDCIRAFDQHNWKTLCVCKDCENTRAIRSANEVKEAVVATVNFCERCETMGKSDVMGLVTISTSNVDPEHGTSRGERHRKELCPGCVDEFIAWLEGEAVGERPRAYKEPWKRPAPEDTAKTSVELFALAIEASKRETGIGD